MMRKVILEHKSSVKWEGLESKRYEIFVHKWLVWRYSYLKKYGYQIKECDYVQDFLSQPENKNLRYVFSEDNLHIPSINLEVEEMIRGLMKKGFEYIVAKEVKNGTR